MSHAGVFRTLAVVVAATSLASCTQSFDLANVAGYKEPTPPFTINITCGAKVSVALTGANGAPAWLVKLKKNDKFAWEVPPNVTIDSIKAKPGQDPLPIDPDGPQGGQGGNPYKSKVKDQDYGSNGKNYPYDIFTTCNPGGGAPPLPLQLDPEMIVH
jgi:hypothetical protein